MRKLFVLVTALLATVFLTAAVPSTSTSYAIDADGDWVMAHRTLTVGDMLIQKARYRTWLLLCLELRDVTCAGIPVPKVETFRPNPLRRGLLGYYDGSDTVFIRSNLGATRREEVLAHEMSHYIDVQLGLNVVPGPALDICFSEKRAWAVSDAYWLRRGVSPKSKKIVGQRWVDWYAHCTPYKDTLYPQAG
jgi:hypothetical protein